MNEIRKILVTGSSGTIGTRLCEKLIEDGYEVIGADHRENKWNKKVNAITIIIDFLKKEEVYKQLPPDVDLIIHLAANARVYNLVVKPSLARDNFESLFNVLEFARINGVKRFIFASSREVYGNSEKTILSEDEAQVKNCESPYTSSKIGGEALVHSYQQCYGINFVITRFSNVYGAYDNSDRVIPFFIKCCMEEKDLIVFGKDKVLDFTYIDDTTEGITLCIKRFEMVKNDIFNIASGQGTSLLTIAELIRELTGANINIGVKESRTGEVIKYIADISKAKSKLGYEPQFTIISGIKNSIAWYKKYCKHITQ